MVEQESRFAKYIPPALGCLTGMCIVTAILAFMYFTSSDQSKEEPNTFPIQNSQPSEMQIIPMASFNSALHTLDI